MKVDSFKTTGNIKKNNKSIQDSNFKDKGP